MISKRLEKTIGVFYFSTVIGFCWVLIALVMKGYYQFLWEATLDILFLSLIIFISDMYLISVLVSDYSFTEVKK